MAETRRKKKLKKPSKERAKRVDMGGTPREWPGPHGPMISKNPDLGSGPYSQNNGKPYGGDSAGNYIKKQRKRRYPAKGKIMAKLDLLTEILYKNV